MKLGTGTGVGVLPGQGITDPSEISGLVQWCEADSVVYSNGLFVSQVNDKSGNNHALVQPTLTKQGQQVQNVINGRPVICFDGVDDNMFVSYTLGQPYTRIIAYRLTTWTANRFIASGRIFNDSLQLITTVPQTRMQSVSGSTIGNINSDIGQLIVATQIFDSANSLLKRNRDAEFLGSVSINNPNGVTVGSRETGANFSNVDFAGLLVYNRALNDAEILNCIKYFENQYGIRYATNKFVSKYKAPSTWANDPVPLGPVAWTSVDKSAVEDNV